MDYFETDQHVARNKVAVIRHSRGGKAALRAGAEDERFAMVCSNESGCGGAALSWRRPDKKIGGQDQHFFSHWFIENFKRYNDREE